MTSAALATMTCKRLSSLISLARALATPNNAFRFRAWRSLSTAVIELAKASSLPVFAIALQEELLNAAAAGQIFSSWKTAPADSDVGAPQHLRRSFIKLIGTTDFFKTRQQVIHS